MPWAVGPRLKLKLGWVNAVAGFLGNGHGAALFCSDAAISEEATVWNMVVDGGDEKNADVFESDWSVGELID